VLHEDIGIEPNLFPLSCMETSKDFGFVISRNLILLSNVLEITSLIGLGSLCHGNRRKSNISLTG
jgi:hypothetical protein